MKLTNATENSVASHTFASILFFFSVFGFVVEMHTLLALFMFLLLLLLRRLLLLLFSSSSARRAHSSRRSDVSIHKRMRNDRKEEEDSI